MRWVKTLLVALVLLAVMAYGVLFSIENSEPVALDLLFAQLPELRLSLWIFFAFALGGIGGLLAGSVSVIRARARHASVSRKLARAEKELDNIRTSAFKS